MTNIGVGKTIYHLRERIGEIQEELNQLSEPRQDLQEIINSTNVLRTNEHLCKINAKQEELLSAYMQHSTVMEELLTSVFEIQMQLKEILKEQSSLISSQKPKTISKSRKK